MGCLVEENYGVTLFFPTFIPFRRVPITTCTTTRLVIILALHVPWRILTAPVFKGKTTAKNSATAHPTASIDFPDADARPRLVGVVYFVVNLWAPLFNHVYIFQLIFKVVYLSLSLFFLSFFLFVCLLSSLLPSFHATVQRQALPLLRGCERVRP